MAPLGPAPEIVSKLKSRNSSLLRRNWASCSAASISLSLPLAACVRRAKPGSGHGRRRRAGAPPAYLLDLHRVLAGLGEGAGIAAAHDFCPRRRQPVEDPGCARSSDRPAPGACPGRGDRARGQLIGRVHTDGVAEMRFQSGHELAPVHEQARPPRRHAARRTRAAAASAARRRRGYSAARRSESGRRQHGGIDLCPQPSLAPRPRALVDRSRDPCSGARGAGPGRSAAPADPSRRHRAGCQRGPPVRRRRGRSPPQEFETVRRMEPRVIAELAARGQVLRDPGLRRLIREMAGARTAPYRPAASPEACSAHRRRRRPPAATTDGEAGRPRETGQPGQPFGPRRHILRPGARRPAALMKPAKPRRCTFGAQGRDPRRRGSRTPHGTPPSPVSAR